MVGDISYEAATINYSIRSKGLNEIEEFIHRRWSNTDAHWLDGNCYWFAQILVMRFPYLRLYYMPVHGHFVAGTPSRYYDAKGENFYPEKPILFEKIEETDPVWAARLLRDCRN